MENLDSFRYNLSYSYFYLKLLFLVHKLLYLISYSNAHFYAFVKRNDVFYKKDFLCILRFYKEMVFLSN